MPNIKAVAQLAGVSVATVSRALNDHPGVGAELRERVESAVRSLDYRPNAIARSLRTRSTKTLVLIISDVSNPFFTAVARGVEDAAQRQGFSVLLCNSDEDPVKERRYLAVAEETRAAGVIISPNNPATDVEALVEHQVPVVAIDRTTRVDVPTLTVRSTQASREATEHLLTQGWRDPAFVSGPRDASTAVARLRGYREAVRAAGLPALVEHGDYREGGGFQATRRLLALDAPPDALFLANSAMTFGALGALRDAGLRVGHDIGLVTFDDPPWAAHVDPALTAVAQPAYELGFRAAEFVLAVVLGTTPAEQPPLRAELIVRRSSLRV